MSQFAQSAQSAQPASTIEVPHGSRLCPFKALRGGAGKPHFAADGQMYCTEHKKRMEARRVNEILKEQENQELIRRDIIRRPEYEIQLVKEKERRNRFSDEEETRSVLRMERKLRTSAPNSASSTPNSTRSRYQKFVHYNTDSESDSDSEEEVPLPPPKSRSRSRSSGVSSFSSPGDFAAPPADARQAPSAATPPVVSPDGRSFIFPGLSQAGATQFAQFMNSNSNVMDQLSQFMTDLSLNAVQPKRRQLE